MGGRMLGQVRFRTLEYVRKVARIPFVEAEHHFAELDDPVALSIRQALNRNFCVEFLWSEVKMVAGFAQLLKPPHKEVSTGLVDPDFQLTVCAGVYGDARLHG
jgi:hypothetical protein